MDNRPVSIKTPIIAFRQSELSFKITYTNLPQMPADISAQVWVGNILIATFDAAITGTSAQFSIPASQIRDLPPSGQIYFLHDGESKFGGTMSVNMGMAPNPSILEYSVSLSGSQEFIVELVSLDAINEQVQIATEKAAEATTQAEISTAGAATATTKATEAEGSATTAVNAMNIALETIVDPRPATFAAMLPMRQAGIKQDFTVQHDEYQGMEQVTYYWNGYKLFVYNTEVPEEDLTPFL